MGGGGGRRCVREGGGWGAWQWKYERGVMNRCLGLDKTCRSSASDLVLSQSVSPCECVILCVCVCSHAGMCVCVCVCACVHASVYACVHACVWLPLCVSFPLLNPLWVFLLMCLFVWILSPTTPPPLYLSLSLTAPEVCVSFRLFPSYLCVCVSLSIFPLS